MASRRSFEGIRPYVVGPRVLDIGAAEGWVGELLSAREAYKVQLLDVANLNRTQLPLRVYNGLDVPFPDRSFDTALLMLTLHHCKAPDHTLDEAVRVTRKRLIVTESTFRHEPGRWLLMRMDRAFNAWRSRNLIPEAEALRFRTVSEWRRAFRERDLVLRLQRDLSCGLHRHVLFVLDRPGQ